MSPNLENFVYVFITHVNILLNILGLLWTSPVGLYRIVGHERSVLVTCMKIGQICLKYLIFTKFRINSFYLLIKHGKTLMDKNFGSNCNLKLIVTARTPFCARPLLTSWAEMTSRLKRKLGELGVDTSSRKANENFCLVRLIHFHWVCTSL